MTVEWEIAREKREAREEGLAEGREEGLAEGREEGLAEGRAAGREAGLAEGRAEGRAEGEKSILLKQIKAKLDKNKSADQIADELEITLSQAQELINSLT